MVPREDASSSASRCRCVCEICDPHRKASCKIQDSQEFIRCSSASPKPGSCSSIPILDPIARFALGDWIWHSVPYAYSLYATFSYSEQAETQPNVLWCFNPDPKLLSTMHDQVKVATRNSSAMAAVLSDLGREEC
jgi:hypothetical protein